MSSSIFLPPSVTLTAVDDGEPVENSSATFDESTAIGLDEWKISKVLNFFLKKRKEKRKQHQTYRFRRAHSSLKKTAVKEQLMVRKEQILRQRHGS